MKIGRAAFAAGALTLPCLFAAAGSHADLPPINPEKQAALDHQFALPAGAPPRAPKSPGFVPAHDPPRSGIELRRITTSDVQAPISGTLFTPTTQWVDIAGGVQLAVYGGSATQEAGAAAVYVWISDLEAGRDLPGTGLFVADRKGPLTLTAVAGGNVQFTCPSGTGTFDLGAHLFRFAP